MKGWIKDEWRMNEWLKNERKFVVFRFRNKPNSIFNIEIKQEFLNLYYTLRLFNIHKYYSMCYLLLCGAVL